MPATNREPDRWPKSTGEVADLLGTNEPYIQSVLRARKIALPALVKGRRSWDREDVERLRSYMKQGPVVAAPVK